jgi:DNA (cytosine-5)-methyltransferase 1
VKVRPARRAPARTSESARRIKAPAPIALRVAPAAAPTFLGLAPGEIIVDHFAGGGGASTGVGFAAGRSPDIAINHNPRAIAMHSVNHKDTEHFIEDIWAVDPCEVCKGRPVGLLWTSPTCTHFSKAKGTALSEESIKLRALAWVTVRWAVAVQPRIICLENVEEFAKWGPLHRQHSEGCPGEACMKGCSFGKKAKRGGKVKEHSHNCPGVACQEKCQIHTPIKSRQGETFRAFIARLEKLGYVVEYRILRACDFGAPTMRRRLFLVARRDGQPIVWSEPTHGPGRAHPHVAAATCIDWEDLGTSIFGRKKPLADKTMRRIAAGVKKFVLERKPFLVPAGYGAKNENDARTQSVDEPLKTICGNRGSHSVVSPVLLKAKTYGGGGNDATDAQKPLGTILCSKRGEHAVASAMLVRTDMHQSNAGCVYAPEDPLRTITSGGGHAIAAPYMVRVGNGERAGQAPRTHDVQKPLGVIMAQRENYAATAAVLIKHNGGHNDDCGSAGQDLVEPLHTVSTRDSKAISAIHLVRYNGDVAGAERVQDVDAPLTTIDTSNRFGVVASHLVKLRGTSDAHVASSASSVEDPVPALSAQGTHLAQVAAFLVKYHGVATEHSPADPLGVVTTKDRYGLVTVEIEGDTYVIVDIRMRMLKPRELYNAQGFPRDYQIDVDATGRPFTRTEQVLMVGNSVPPQMAEMIARAQLFGPRNQNEEVRAAA